MSSEEGIADVSVKEILHPVTAQDNVVHEYPKETHHIMLMNTDPATDEGKIPQDTSKVKGSPVVLDKSIVPETEYKEVNKLSCEPEMDGDEAAADSPSALSKTNGKTWAQEVDEAFPIPDDCLQYFPTDDKLWRETLLRVESEVDSEVEKSAPHESRMCE